MLKTKAAALMAVCLHTLFQLVGPTPHVQNVHWGGTETRFLTSVKKLTSHRGRICQ